MSQSYNMKSESKVVFQILCVFLVLLSLDSATAVNPTYGTETDQHTLLDFKNHIVGDPFHIMSSWNDSIHHCNWTGITCSISNGRVISLILVSKRLNGTLTPFIGNLTFLTTLVLENNLFHGEFPQEVGCLMHLQYLYIDENYFSGSIPNNMTHCTQLTKLNVERNNFTGTIPTWIGNLSSLTIVSFTRNKLHGNIPHEVCRLSSLTFLLLSDNFLSGTIPSLCYNISSLSTFEFGINHLHGNIPSDVGFTLPNLVSFVGAYTNFTGTIPASLVNATKLENFGFSQCGLTGTLPKNIGNLHRLLYLDLDGNNLGSGRANDLAYFNSLVNCTVLQELALNGNNFGGELPRSIGNFSTQLHSFDISSNKIEGNIPVEIGNLVNMSLLHLQYNKLNGSIPDGLFMLQNLQVLSISGNEFSGRISSSIGKLSLLIELYMDENYFEGSIPSSLGNCQKLLLLNLSSNKLSGSIPKEVMSISSLTILLDVSHNALSGSLPPEVDKLVTLGKLDLSENNFSGIIPSTLGTCSSLERLYLQGNYFEGSIPQTLQNLRGLQYIDLSRNNFSGKIPEFLAAFTGLLHLNLSYNDFEGEIPRNGIFKSATSISIYGNNKLCGGIPELKLPACTIRRTSLLRKLRKPKNVILVVSAFVILLFISCFVAILMVMRRTNKASKSEDLELAISYSVIAKCTDGFSQDNIIGSGSFGSVYKGYLSSIGQTIAIKVLNLKQRGASRSFIDECRVLKNTRHRNLLKIITVISSVDHQGNDFKALVFEFMSKGSLEDWLHPANNMRRQTNTLTFIQRLNIAIDVACALEYLHHFCQTSIVHCDIKPSNVLLDNDMVAHVGDFGLATFLFNESSDFSIQSSMSAILKGSIGYIPPEYGMGGQPSTLGDIYSYGILLLEIFTRKKPTDEMFEGDMGTHKLTSMALPNRVMDIIDPSLLSEQEYDDIDHEISINETSIRRRDMEYNVHVMMEDWLVSVLQIGVSCSSTSPSERIPMPVVVNKLQAIKNSYLRFNNLQ